MKAVFVDTGAFLARAMKRDQHHRAATLAWRALEKAPYALVSSEHVLDETVTLLTRWAGAANAINWTRLHLSSKRLVWLQASPRDWEAAVEILAKLADHAPSFTDCLSFALMRRERIDRAFAFDRHFEVAGFKPYRGQKETGRRRSRGGA